MSRRGTSGNVPSSHSNVTTTHMRSSSSRTSRVERSSQGLTQAGSRQASTTRALVSRATGAPGSGAANSAQRRTRDVTPSVREGKRPRAPWDTPGNSTPAASQRRTVSGSDFGKRSSQAGNALARQSSLDVSSRAAPLAPQQPPASGGPQPGSIATGQVRGRSLPAPLPEAAARSRTPSRPNPLLAGSTSPKSASSGTPVDAQQVTVSSASQDGQPPGSGRWRKTLAASLQDQDLGSAARTPSRGPARPNPLLSSSPKRERSLSRGPSAAADLGLFENLAGATDDIHIKVETDSADSGGGDVKKSTSARSSHERHRSKERKTPDRASVINSLEPAAFLSSLFSAQPEEENQKQQTPRRGSSSTRRKMASEASSKRGQHTSLPPSSSQRIGKSAGDHKLAPWDIESQPSVDHSPKKQAGKPLRLPEQLSRSSLSSEKEGSGSYPELHRSGSNSSNSFGTTPSFSREKGMNRTASFGISPEEAAQAIQGSPKRKEKAREAESMSHSSMLSSDRRNRRAVIQEISSPATPSSVRGSSRGIRQISGFISNFRDDGSPMKTKVPLAQLAVQPPLVVHLTHIQDLRIAPGVLVGTKVPAYSQLGCLLHEQRALGKSLHRTDVVALLRWYLPYLMLVAAHVGAIVVAGLMKETLLLCMPLFVALPVLHYLRCWRCDWLLCKAVDSGALVEFLEQLKAPLGWGTSNQFFAATLTAAMQAFQPAPQKLVVHPRQRFSTTPVITAGVGMVLLGIFRVLRLISIAVPPEADLAISSVALVILVVFGCSPLSTRPRSSEADLRLSVIEAAFNALLDTLRPLMGDTRAVGLGAGTKLPQPPLPLAMTEVPQGTEAASQSRFSVRLVTSDRNTLRATLHICGPSQQQKPSKREPGAAAMCVSCALGGFSILAEHLEGATPMDLGASAAGAGELGGHASSPQGLTSLAATMGIHLGRDTRTRQRADDEVSVSLASVSTASTLRRGGNHGPSQASLTKAMSMVSKISARKDPLEVFRSANDCGMAGAIVPAKTILDEPALLLALSEGQSDVLSGAQCPAELMRFIADAPADRRWLACRGCCRPSMHMPREAEDSLGVLRNDMELRQLCRANAGVGPFGTPVSTQHPPTPNSRQHDSDLDTSSDDEERERASRPNPVDGHLTNLSDTTSKHLAVIFDSHEERNHCLAMLGQVQLLPDKTCFALGAWP